MLETPELFLSKNRAVLVYLEVYDMMIVLTKNCARLAQFFIQILRMTHHTMQEMVAIIRKSKRDGARKGLMLEGGGGGINYVTTAPSTIAS